MGGSHFLWLAADRESGRVEVYLVDIGRVGGQVYVLENQSLRRYGIHSQYLFPSENLELGGIPRQVATEGFTGFANSAFSNVGSLAKVDLPFPWADGVEVWVDGARTLLDPDVDLPGSVTITVNGRRHGFLIEDALWDVELPPEFFEDSPQAVAQTAAIFTGWLIDGRLRVGVSGGSKM